MSLENQKKIYELTHKLKHNSRAGNKIGCVKIWKGNTYEHELVKFQVAFKLISQGYRIYTESEFETGGRGDIIAISQDGKGYVLEVLKSETESRFLAKFEVYPEEFELIRVNVDKFDIEKWDL